MPIEMAQYKTKIIQVNGVAVRLHSRDGKTWLQCETNRIKTDQPMVVSEILGVGAKKTANYGSGTLGTPGHLDRNRKILRISRGKSLRKKHHELHQIIVARDAAAARCELQYLREDLIFDPARRVDKPVPGAFAVMNNTVLVPGTTQTKINIKED